MGLWWSSGVVAQSPSPTVAPEAGQTQPPSAAVGSNIFQAECSRCHGPSGEGAIEGPSLHALPAGDDTISGVEEIVRLGGVEMDAFGDELSDAEIAAVAQYVVAEFATAGDVAHGGELYRLNCAGCHGAAAGGGALIYSERNAPSLSDVSLAKVVAAIRGGPGTMPAFNQAALGDASVASVARYVGALQDPADPGGVAIPPPGPVTEGFVAGLIGLGAALLAAIWLTRGGRG